MNRGGLAGATWTMDDRFTAYDTAHLRAANLDAGKLLLRIDYNDAGTVPTLAGAAQAVQELNDAHMMAMVEPIPYTKNDKGEAVWDTDPLALREGRWRQRGARRIECVHLVEDPGDGRHRHGRQGDDATAVAARRRARVLILRRPSHCGRMPSINQLCVAS